MSKHRRLDLSTRYRGKEDLPPHRLIEKAEVKIVLKKDPDKENVEREPYLPDLKLIEAVNLAIALGRPLLLQGEPGCGKTCLAAAVAYELGLPLEKTYIKSTSRAQDLLYTYDAVNRLYDAQLGVTEQGQHSRDVRHYIDFGPLGRAIVRAEYGRRSVVLIDEIDKADLDFPNDLLWEIDRLEFKVAEAPDMKYAVPKEQPELRPIVFVTHNEEKALPPAFLRRCIFYYVEFPKEETHLQQILALHQIPNRELSQRAIDILNQLRTYNLIKKPGLGELLDWVSYLQAVKTPVEDLGKLPYSGVLLKQQEDEVRVKGKTF